MTIITRVIIFIETKKTVYLKKKIGTYSLIIKLHKNAPWLIASFRIEIITNYNIH